MTHIPHWSGAHCHECFIRQVASEPHPLDDDPSMKATQETMLDYYKAMVRPPMRRDVLPAHYKPKR